MSRLHSISGSARVAETPNAVMTTLASPTLSGTRKLSVWTVRLDADAKGPVHTFNKDQVWTMTSGAAHIVVDDERHHLTAGDCLTIGGGQIRQVLAITACDFIVCGFSDSAVVVVGEDSPRPAPAWIL